MKKILPVLLLFAATSYATEPLDEEIIETPLLAIMARPCLIGVHELSGHFAGLPAPILHRVSVFIHKTVHRIGHPAPDAPLLSDR